MTRTLLLAPVAMAALAMACGPQVWSFDYVDAASGTPGSNLSSGSNQAIEADAGIVDASSDGAPGDGSAPGEAGLSPSGCPINNGSGSGVDCTPCADSGDCRKPGSVNPVCGAEKRCVECTAKENGCPLDAGPRVCVDEHCVIPCSKNADCRSALCFRVSGADAGYCAECETNTQCAEPAPACSALICAECNNLGLSGQCEIGICSANGYCTGLN